MAANKVVYGGKTLIDLTADTATEATVLKGYKFHKKDGTIATGTYTAAAASALPLVINEYTGQLIYAAPYVDFTTGKLMYPAADGVSMSINSSGNLLIGGV